MKSLVFAVLFSGILCAQPPQPSVQATPGAPAQATPAAALAPDTIVMEANGKKYTVAEVEHLVALLPPQTQQQARSSPQAMTSILTSVLVYQKLAEDAVKNGRDNQSPYKESIEFFRMQTLAQAEMTITGNSLEVPVAEQEKYYKDHPEKFQEAKVRVIYAAFNPAPDKTGPDGKKVPTEAEAKARIDDLRKQIVAGADFGKLARENSEDKTSAAKDGDFGVIKHASPYPEPFKAAVFALKQGEMSQPIKLQNGFYLIRVEELKSPPYSEASVQIVQDLRQERFSEWMKNLQTQFTIKVDNPAYFSPKAPAQLQQVR